MFCFPNRPAKRQIRFAIHRVQGSVADAPQARDGSVHDAHRGVRGAHDARAVQADGAVPIHLRRGAPASHLQARAPVVVERMGEVQELVAKMEEKGR